MSDSNDVIAEIQVIPVGIAANEASGIMPEALTIADVSRIATVINRVSAQIQDDIEKKTSDDRERQLQLSEVEISFGIDISAQTKIPIISQIFSTQMEAGATFQVKITLINT